MQNIYATIFLFLSSFLLAQFNFEPTLEATFNKAKLENKDVFIEYYNETCPVCKGLEPFFEKKELSDFYNDKFVS